MEVFYHESYGPGLMTRKFCPMTYGKQDYTSRAWMTARTVLLPVGRGLRREPPSDARQERQQRRSDLGPLPLRLLCWKWLRFTGIYFHPDAVTSSKHWRTLFLSPDRVLALSDLLIGPQPRMVTMDDLGRMSEVMVPVLELPEKTVIRVLTTWVPKSVVRNVRERVRQGRSAHRSEVRREKESLARRIMYTLPVWNIHCSCHCQAEVEECQMCLQLWVSKQDRFQFE